MFLGLDPNGENLQLEPGQGPAAVENDVDEEHHEHAE